MAKDYKRVSCDFYDLLESTATLKQKISITYQLEDGTFLTKEAFIQTLETKDKAEYLILKDQTRIRLDHISSLKPITKKD